MTTVNAALKAWESKEGVPLAEAKVVKLYCQIPPISKLDNSLNNLTKCEQLSLSTNQIDRLISMSGLTNLKILSVGRNNLKKFEKLEDVAGTLTEIWASYNSISSLDGLQALANLEILYLSNNNISNWAELEKLAANTKLKDVLLVGNPIYEDLTEEERRIKVLQAMSSNTNLMKIDNVLITPTERELAKK